MSLTLASVFRWSLIVAGIIAYPVAADYTTATAVADRFPVLGLAVSLMPLLAILSWLAWRLPRRAAAFVPVVRRRCATAWARSWSATPPRRVPAPPSLPVRLRWT